MQIYILEKREQRGPFTLEEVQTKVDSGEYSAGMLAWYKGLPEWQKLGEVFPSLQFQEVTKTEPPSSDVGGVKFYILEKREQRGPFTLEELQAKIQAGECTKETLGWHSGLAGWQPLAQLHEFEWGGTEQPPIVQATQPHRLPTKKQWFNRPEIMIPISVVLYALMAYGYFTSDHDKEPTSSTALSPFDKQKAQLQEIGQGAFGAYRFDRVTITESFGNNSDMLLREARITIKEAVTEGPYACRCIIAFFQEAKEQGALDGIGYFSFNFSGDLLFDDGRTEKNANLLRIGVTGQRAEQIQWENMQPGMLLRLLGQGSFELWFTSKLDWSSKGWENLEVYSNNQ